MSAGQDAAAATPGQAAYELWAEVLGTNGVECEPFGNLGNVEQMAWREVEAMGAATAVTRGALHVALQTLRDIAWGALVRDVELSPLRDPSLHADKALIAIRDLGVGINGAVTAAAAAQPAPGHVGCKCGHPQADHGFSTEMCGWLQCPCMKYLGAEQPAPELAAVREQLAIILSRFTDNGSGRTARVSATVIARAYRDGGLTVPNELRKFL